MQFRHKLAVITALFCCTFAGAQTTQFTGTVKDLTNTPVATGLVNFTLQPGADTTISGVGRFTPNTVTCSIVNQAISAIARAANVVTVTTSSAHGFTTGDLVNIVGVTDTSYNANGLTITVTSPTTFTFAQTAGNSSSSGGFAGNLFKFGGTGACTVVNNLSLNPPGTSYKIQLCPLNACTSQFNGYALGGVTDLTTIVPTPGTLPAFHFVDTFANQTVGGNKIFTGANTFSGSNTFSNANTFSANNSFTQPQTLVPFADPVPALGLIWMSLTNAGRLKWSDAGALRTVVGTDTTDILTGKTYDTAGAGNSFLINGLAATANTGTGSVVRATSPAIATPTLTGTTQVNRIRATQGSALIAADFAMSGGFGNTASAGPILGTDAAFSVTVTSAGTGQAANPTLTLTFHDGTWTNSPLCVPGTGPGNDTRNATWSISSVSATVLILQLVDTPVAGSHWGVTVVCEGR